jgi:hypothetical protein
MQIGLAMEFLSLPLERRGDQHRLNRRRQMTPWCCRRDFRVSCCFSEKLMNKCSEKKTQQWNLSLASIEELPAEENHHTRAAVNPPQTQNPQFQVTLPILRYRNQAQQ